MALYLISYDIIDKDAFEYDNLYKKLRDIGAVRILYSEWAVAEDVGKAEDIYKEIASLTLTADRLLVQELTKDCIFDALLISEEKFTKLLQSARG